MTAGSNRPARFRWPYLILAYGCIGLAAVGVVVPGLPTTPFLLVAAWAAGRGSERMHRWLHTHRHFGPLLRNWQEQRAVPRRAKYIAVATLVVSWVILTSRATGLLVPLVSAGFFVAVATFLLTRPEPAAGVKDAKSVE